MNQTYQLLAQCFMQLKYSAFNGMCMLLPILDDAHVLPTTNSNVGHRNNKQCQSYPLEIHIFPTPSEKRTDKNIPYVSMADRLNIINK
jgi:hypothetical protein